MIFTRFWNILHMSSCRISLVRLPLNVLRHYHCPSSPMSLAADIRPLMAHSSTTQLVSKGSSHQIYLAIEEHTLPMPCKQT